MKTGKSYKVKFSRLISLVLAVFLIVQCFAVVAAQEGAVPTDQPVAEGQQAEPTPAPTPEPSAAPTPEPSAAPSATPTPEPSAAPSATPTPAPSAAPSATPTPAPSVDPALAAVQSGELTAQGGEMTVQGDMTPQDATDPANVDFQIALRDVEGSGSPYTIETGKTFQLELGYTVNLNETNGTYTNFAINIEIPQGMVIAGEYVTGGTDIVEIKIVEDGPPNNRKKYLRYVFDTSAVSIGEYKTTMVPLAFPNVETPGGVTFTVNPIFTGTFAPEGQTGTEFQLTMPAGQIQKVVSKVTDKWEVVKSVSNHEPLLESDKYRVTYKLEANLMNSDTGLKKDDNSYGRYGIDSFQLTDVFDLSNLSPDPVAGLPTFVSLREGAADGAALPAGYYTLADASDQTVAATQGTAFKTLSINQEMTMASAGGLGVPAGTARTAVYYLTVDYPRAPFDIESDVPDDQVDQHKTTVPNDAELTVEYPTGSPEVTTDDDYVLLGVKKGVVGAQKLTVEKWISVGDPQASGTEFVLDSAAQARYGTATFTLYDTDGTSMAIDAGGSTVSNNPATIDGAGQVVFENLKAGKTYYLEETNTPNGVTHPGGTPRRWAVSVDTNGAITTVPNDLTVSGSGELIVTNPTDASGIVKFVKQGTRATENGPVTEPLGGVVFELSSVANGKTDANAYTATSDSNGNVVFYDVLAGTDYVLTEVSMSSTELEEEFGLTTEKIIKSGITITADAINTLTLTSLGILDNTAQMTKLKLVKTSAHQVEIEGQNQYIPLSGATFELYGPFASDPVDSNGNIANAATVLTGKYITTVTDMALSYWETPLLQPDSYYVFKEITPPDGYAIAKTYSSGKTATIAEGKINTVTVRNNKLVEINFRKYLTPFNDPGTGLGTSYPVGVDGVEFKVYASADPSDTTELNTGDMITVMKQANDAVTEYYLSLPVGKYYYEETWVGPPATCPYPIAWPTGRVEFEVTADDLKSDKVTKEIWNTTDTAARVEFVKRSSVSPNALMGGMSFNLYGPFDDDPTNGGLVVPTPTQLGTVKENIPIPASGTSIGKAISSFLTAGKWYYYEEVIPPGAAYFPTASSTGAFKLVTNTQVAINVQNDPGVNVQFTKQDSVTSVLLTGASFNLYDDISCTTPLNTNPIVTGTGGTLNFTGLTPGKTYYFKEITPKTDYDNNETVYRFVAPPINPDGSNSGSNPGTFTTLYKGDSNVAEASPVVKNDRMAIVKVYKEGNWDNGSGTSQDIPLNGAVFKLYKGGTIVGGVYQNDGTLYATSVAAGTAGNYIFNNIEPGTYILVEDTPPPGYELSATPAQQITVRAGDNKDGAVEQGGEPGYLDKYRAITYTFTNVADEGKIKIDKRSSVSDSTNVAAKFTLEKLTSTPPATDVVDTTYNESGMTNGKLEFSTTTATGTWTSDYLPEGWYKLTELETPKPSDGTTQEYVVKTDPIYIYVTAGEMNVENTVGGANGAVKNEPTGKMFINKWEKYTHSSTSGETGTERWALNGAVFRVFKQVPGKTFAEAYPQAGIDDVANSGCLTNLGTGGNITVVNGVWTSPNLPPGDYWVYEYKTPSTDYVADTINPKEVKVVAGESTSTAQNTVDFDNTTGKGRILLYKYDLTTGLPLNLALFDLYEVIQVDGTEPATYDAKTTVGGVTYYMNVIQIDLESGQRDGRDGGDDGYALSRLLTAGKQYFLYEKQAPPLGGGHYEIIQPWTGPIDVVAGQVTQANVPNAQNLVDPEGKKLDDDENGLGGAWFAAFDTQQDALDMQALIKTRLSTAGGDKTVRDKVFSDLAAELAGSTPAELLTKYGYTGIVSTAVSEDGTGKFVFENLMPLRTYYYMELVPPTYKIDGVTYYYLWPDTAQDILSRTVDATGKFDGEVGGLLTIQNVIGGTFVLHKQVTISGETFPVDNVPFLVYPAKWDTGTSKWILDDGVTWDTPATVGYTGTAIKGGGTAGNYRSITLPPGDYIIIEGGEEFNDLVNDPPNYTFPASINPPDPDRSVRPRYYVEIKAGEENTVHFDTPIENTAKYGGFLLRKQDGADPTKTLSATFTLWQKVPLSNPAEYVEYPNSSSNVINTLSAEDYYISKLLPPGDYQLREVSVDTPGYTALADGQYINFSIAAGKLTVGATSDPDGRGLWRYIESGNFDPNTDTPITVSNFKKGSLTLTKYGHFDTNDYASKLVGVNFELYRESGDNPATLDSDDILVPPATGTYHVTVTGGVLTITGLPAWDGVMGNGGNGVYYWLKEINHGSNANYKLLANPIRVLVKPDDASGNTVTVVPGTGSGTAQDNEVINMPSGGKVTIEKRDGYDDTLLGGVKFNIFKLESGGARTAYGSITTGTGASLGVATSGLLPVGDYVLVEVYSSTTNPGYLPHGEEIPFSITENGLTKLTKANNESQIKNYLGHKLVVTKLAGDTTDPIIGAEFSLYVDDGDGLYDATKDTTLFGSGPTIAPNGTLTFEGLKPNTTYWLIETYVPGDYTLDKTAIKITTANDNTPLTVTKTVINEKQGAIALTKMIDWSLNGAAGAQRPLQDAVFAVYNINTPTVEAGRATTDVNGQCTIGPLDAGTYILKEISSLASNIVEGDPTTHITIDTAVVVEKGKTNKVWFYDKATYNDEDPDVPKASVKGPVENIAGYGKFDLNYFILGTTDERLPDGEFTLEAYVYDKNTQTWSWQPAVTDANGNAVGKITPPNDKAYPSGYFPAGKYRLTQTKATDGYNLINSTTYPNPREFQIEAGQTTVVNFYSDALGAIALKKTSDATYNASRPITGGGTFKLYKEGGAYVCDLTYDATYSMYVSAKDAKGFYTIAPGKYYIMETVAPANHKLNNAAGDRIPAAANSFITMPSGIKYPYSVSETAAMITQTAANNSSMGAIQIEKYSDASTPQPLEGAVFNIYDKATGALVDQNLTTAAGTGRIVSKLLEAGKTYTVKEMKAPTGFIYDNNVTPWEQDVYVQPIQDPVTYNQNLADAQKLNYALYKNVNQLNGGTGMPGGITKSADPAVPTKSLLEEEFSTVFSLRDYTTGTNMVPFDDGKLTVTDNVIQYYYKDSNGYQLMTDPADIPKHKITQVKVYGANNGGGSTGEIYATLEYQNSGNFGSNTWLPTSIEFRNLQDIATSASRVSSLGGLTDVMAVRVTYHGAGIKFTAGGIDLHTTFEYRGGDFANKNRHEVRQVTNVASLDYTYTIYGNDPTAADYAKNKVPGHKISNQVALEFPTIYDKKVPISVNIDRSYGTQATVSAGGYATFTATFTNESQTENYVAPVFVIEAPVNTTIVDTWRDRTVTDTADPPKYDYSFINRNLSTLEPSAAHMTLAEYNDMRDSQNRQYEYLILTFNDVAQYLAPGESFVVTFRVITDSAQTGNLSNLPSTAYASSMYMMPPSKENTTGTSVTGFAGVEMKQYQNLTEKTRQAREFVTSQTQISITANTRLAISKRVKADADQSYSIAPVTVYPNGGFSYDITVRNGSTQSGDYVRYLRVVDVLPVQDDTAAVENSQSNNPVKRGTTTPEGPTITSVSYPTPANGSVVMYYSTTSWTNDSRMANGSQTGMLHGTDATQWTEADWTANGFTQGEPADWSQVTAVGFQVDFGPQKEYWLGTGAGVGPGGADMTNTYSAKIHMNAPGFTADDAEEFLSSVMNNTAGMSAGKGETGKTSPSLESNKVAVYLKIPTGEIGDYVWIDFNQNGVQDEDPALYGVVGDTSEPENVTLITFVKDQFHETSYETPMYSGANGYYLFDNLTCNALKPGAPQGSTAPNDYIGGKIYSYIVEFTPPDASYSATTRYQRQWGGDETNDSNIDEQYRSERVYLNVNYEAGKTVTGDKNHTIDAGFIQASVIGDWVWLDEVVKNGMQDTGEIGVNGVTVNLYKKNDKGEMEFYATMLTTNMNTDGTGSRDGAYLFKDLPMGDYVVEFDVSKLVNSFIKPLFNFTEAKSPLDTSVKGDFDSDARYIVNGNEWVRRTDEIKLDNTLMRELQYDAGLILYSAISGLIFEDPGYVDFNELNIMLPGSRATLYYYPDAQQMTYGVMEQNPAAWNLGPGIPQGTITVGDDGKYRFDNLIDGTYRVYFELADRYAGIEYEKTGDPDADSHMGFEVERDEFGNIVSGYSEVLPIASKGNPNPFDETHTVYDNINAGGRLYSSLGDFVWRDLNNNGLQDPGEPGIPGIKVTLQRRANNGAGDWETRGSDDTDENGYYRFDELEAGPDSGYQYRVIFGFTPREFPTEPRAGSDREIDSDMTSTYIAGLGYTTEAIDLAYDAVDLSWDAGIVTPKNAVGDYVWFDTNGNGRQDEGEPPVGGIPVALDRNISGIDEEDNWVEVATTETNQVGWYNFQNMDVGNYRVRFQIDPDRYMPTVANVGEPILDSDASIALENNWYASKMFFVDEDTNDMTWDAGLIDDSVVQYINGNIYDIYQTRGRGTRGFRTGDETNMTLWLIVFLAAGVGVVCAVLVRRRLTKGSGRP